MSQAIAVTLLIACFVGIIVCGLVQQSIRGEMEMRLGDPPNLTLLQLWSRQRVSAEREFRQRYPDDRLIRRLRVTRILFFCIGIGTLILLFGVLPHWAPPSR